MVDQVKKIPEEPEEDTEFLPKETLKEMEIKLQKISRQTVFIANKL